MILSALMTGVSFGMNWYVMGQEHRRCSVKWGETWYRLFNGGSWTRGQSTSVFEEGYAFSGVVDTRTLDPYVACCEALGFRTGLWWSEGTFLSFGEAT